MALNTSIVFASEPYLAMATLDTANANTDGTTGDYETIAEGGTDGRRIDSIRIKSVGAVDAGMIRLFLDDGTNVKLWREIEVEAGEFERDIVLGNPRGLDGAFALPAGWSIIGSTVEADTFNVFAQGGDLAAPA